ncbi:MAG: hypothetical protein WBV72_03435, partial [Nitrososphaeraceae archaeon]
MTILQIKYIIGTAYHTHKTMRQEHITLKNVEISQLFDRIKEHLQEIKLDIIHEEKEKDYWNLKAHKGS